MTLLRGLDSDVSSVAPVKYLNDGVELSSLVDFEWVGLTSTLEGTSPKHRGANATSADALILADLDSGGRRAYLIEWKYVEKYTDHKYLGGGKPGTTRLNRYSPRYYSPSSPFRQEIPLEEWLYEPFYQDLRLILLGQMMVELQELGVTEATALIVCPLENDAYRCRITSPHFRARFPAAATADEVLQNAVGGPNRIRMASQQALFLPVARQHSNDLAEWIQYHSERYGWG